LYALAPDAVRQIEPLANAGGWSGSRLWRVTVHDGTVLCLRRWPVEHPTPAGLRMIHAVLGLVSAELLIVAVPLRTCSGSTVCEAAGHRWELTNWLKGNADFHTNPSRLRLRSVMQTLARFHVLAARYEWRRGAAPAVDDRRVRFGVLRFRELATIERSLSIPLGNQIDDRAVRLLTLARKAIESPNLFNVLSSAPELWLQPAIRDIHHDHVLFTGDEVTGLIDFGAMRIDTPLTDIARLVGSLVGDDRDARQFAFDAYSELRPLSEFDHRLINALDASGLVIGGLNWLTWLYVEHRDMGPVEPILRRLDQILMRLESWK
jgi:homoserine kinase type II